ncbi:MAG TPA: FAD-binding oxidoreductase [Candidatus Babeliales bacterium]|nr:FAD-binding oxidoreductase [Candidatus Babeliales bacterium]
MQKKNKQYIPYTFCILTIMVTINSSIYYAKNKTKNRSFSLRQLITDKLGITSIQIKKIITPYSVEELQNIVRKTHEPISIAGECYSQGGQVAYPDGIIINMKQLNKIIEFNYEQKTITIQAGATWYDIQKYIDPYNLSIAAMQSYNNFSIGGSLSVNVHGRDTTYCQLINTVQSIQIITADGSLVVADRTNNKDLFCAAIGGYGLLGIITQATLKLTDNIPLERQAKICHLKKHTKAFQSNIAPDESIVFYNADIFPKRYNKCLITTWHATNKTVTDQIRLRPQNTPFYLIDKTLELFIKRIPFAKLLRPLFEELKIKKPLIVWRNNEMSYSLNQLALNYHLPTTMTLQEYFVPIEHADAFTQKLCSIIKKNWVNVLNISIRYVKPDQTSIMSYAQKESFSFVLYLNMINTQKYINRSCIWTQKIIDAALGYNGSYYLPYIMCATPKQFNQAYPQFKKLLEIKKIYDPTNKFRNMLWKKYAQFS